MTYSQDSEQKVVVVDVKKSVQDFRADLHDRTRLYQQYFSQPSRAEKPNAFIEQVNGYGVQVFAQASSFVSR